MTAFHALRTHQQVRPELCGVVRSRHGDVAEVHLQLTEDMRADDTGLVHGGFIFGAADFAAMACVDEPTVVLASAEVSFTKPARVGEVLVFHARVASSAGRRRHVEVDAFCRDAKVFSGSFACVVPSRHVLDKTASGFAPTGMLHTDHTILLHTIGGTQPAGEEQR
jgi:acyl-coenzyme A thioesterase PaaI-like protein